jgi:hypothetical protein
VPVVGGEPSAIGDTAEAGTTADESLVERLDEGFGDQFGREYSGEFAGDGFVGVPYVITGFAKPPAGMAAAGCIGGSTIRITDGFGPSAATSTFASRKPAAGGPFELCGKSNPPRLGK